MGVAIKLLVTVGLGVAAGWLGGTYHNYAVDKAGRHLNDVVDQLPNPPPEPNVRLPRPGTVREALPRNEIPRNTRRIPAFEPNRRFPPELRPDGNRRRPPFPGSGSGSGSGGSRRTDHGYAPEYMPPPPPPPAPPAAGPKLDLPHQRPVRHRGYKSRPRG